MTLKKQSSASPFKSQGNFIPAPLKTGLPLWAGEITGTRVQKGVEAGDSGLALLQGAPLALLPPPGPPGPPSPQLVHIFASLEVLPANTLGFLTDVKVEER